MIINIRGTSGSGKSTIVQKLMLKWNTDFVLVRGKIEAYLIRSPYGPIYVIGPYRTACGGCDAIKTQDEICKLVKKYAKLGHVIFEGVIVSTIYERYKKLMLQYGGPYRFIFLNTPLDVCLSRIRQRRKAAGNKKPLDPTTTKAKYEAILRVIDKCEADKLHYDVVSSDDAVGRIVQFIKQVSL